MFNKINKSIRKISYIFDKYGTPETILHAENFIKKEPKGNQVICKMLAASVNPADILSV